MNTDDTEDKIEDALECSPDMFEDDMDVDFDADRPETSSKKLKLDISPKSWKGVSMFEIYKSISPWSSPEFPLVSPSSVHAVVYHISRTTGTMVGSTPPVPQKGKDVWDKDHVRLPHSSESLYASGTTPEGQPILRKRWDLIVEALSQNITNSHELQEAILKYNSRYKSIWTFHGLHKLFNSYLEEEEANYFFKSTLPSMVKLALRLPELIQCPIPLLRQNHNRSISLSQEQIACLLANAFFCTFPRRNAQKGKSEYSTYPDINFARFFQCSTNYVMEKYKCIFNYFRRVCKNVPCGVVTYIRRTVIPNSCPDWDKLDHPIKSIPLHITSTGTIEEDGVGLLQVDFANRFLGGGVLGHGCVQEEIRFVICPELMISMLFTECLKPTESLLMIGCERFNNYKGYADRFEWAGNHEDGNPYDASGRRRCAILAIDALFFNTPRSQYLPALITRELHKAWVGFSHYSEDTSVTSEVTLPGVGTGNWGCGAFRGSPHLKALLQLMACCVTRRPLVYYTFGDEELRDDVYDMYCFLSKENVTVGVLYKTLCQFKKSSKKDLYEFIRDKIKMPVVQHLSKVFKTMIKTSKPILEVAKNVSKAMDMDETSNSTNNVKKSLEDSKFQDCGNNADKDVNMEVTPTTNSRFIEQVSLLDDNTHVKSLSPTITGRKVGSLSFFECETVTISDATPSKSTSNSNQVPASDSTPNVKRKSCNKISDYFQCIPKKGS